MSPFRLHAWTALLAAFAAVAAINATSSAEAGSTGDNSAAATSAAVSEAARLSTDADPVETLMAQTIERSYDLSFDEALQQVRAQDHTVERARRLYEAIGKDNWGGSRIDRTDGGRLIASVKDPEDARRRADQAGVPVNDTTLEQVDLSVQELEAKLADASKKLDDDGVEVVLGAVAVGENVVKIEYADTPENRERVANSQTDDNKISYKPTSAQNVEAGCSYWYVICSKPLRGGVEIYSNNGWICSGGFVVRSKTDHLPYVLTAGHCVINAGYGPTWKTAFDTGSHHDIGAAHRAEYDLNDVYEADWAILRIDNPWGSSGWGLPVQTRVHVRSHGGYHPTTWAENYMINQVSGNSPPALPGDAIVCKTGGTTGTNCFIVWGIVQNAVFAQIPTTGGALNGRLCQGDSGGPVYSNNKAYGIVTRLFSSGTYTYNRYIGGAVQVECASPGDNIVYHSMAVALYRLKVELMP